MNKTMRIFVAAAAALALMAAGGEAVLRGLGAYATWPENNGGPYASPYQAGNSSWLLTRAPNIQTSYHQPEFDYSLSTNSLGLRDTEHPLKKPENQRRILVMGDSLVEGQGAPFEKAWPRVLEKRLNSLERPMEYCVIMGGVAGSDPFYCNMLLEKKLAAYDPDVVILALNSFDITDVAARGGGERFRPGGLTVYKTPPWWEPLFAKSRMARFVFMKILGYDWLLSPPSRQDQVYQKARGQILALALGMDKAARDRGAAFMVALQPHLHEVLSGQYAHGLDQLGRDAEASGVKVCDILPFALQAMSGSDTRPQEFYWKKDYHPNSKGYALFAQCVSGCLALH